MSDPAAGADGADMERLAAGDDAALDRLIGRHSGRLHGYLLRLLQNATDAEDLAQETFARVYTHRHRFDTRHGFGTWLYAIATNLVRDRYRWRSRHPEVPLDASLPGAGSNPDTSLSASLTAPTPSPADAMLAKERARAVREAVADLPPEWRAPLVLAVYEARSHTEIGAILGCSAKAVEVRIYRARQRLRQRLGDWLVERSSTAA